ncbi:hypothetical protein [Marinactinospora rubrisoli]|uniref:DUF1640 domain-containing protein n=1 Tax=Marinactinospora rubrisoli TaxID=2715399 RepID=A0ABW2KP82_9ACTN
MEQDQMTLGELARLIGRVERGQQELRAEISQRLDRTVSSDIYAVQHAAIQTEIAELKSDVAAVRKEAEEGVGAVRGQIADERRQRVADRRWWLAAVGIPLATVVLPYLDALFRGGS